MAARTQGALLRRIDEQSRRALRTGEEADVRGLIRMYDEALADLRAILSDSLDELEDVDGDDRRRAYLSWKINREHQLSQQIERRLAQLRSDWTLAFRDGLLRQATEQALWEGYAIDQATPPSIRVDVSAMTATIPDAVVNAPWKGAMFSDRIWLLTDDIAREMQQQVGQGALLGESVDQIVRRIRDLDVLDGNVPPRYAIETLARTELMRASDRARELSYAENSDVVTGEEVVVSLDQRTCEICGPIDGKLLDSDEVQDWLAANNAESRPPFHPRCRDTTAPRLKPWGELLSVGEAPDDLERFEDEERVIRDPRTGKSRLAPTMDFAEWQRFARGTALGVALRR